MFGRSEEESLKAAEAVAGKAREATARGPLAARSPEPGQASANISLVFQSVSLKITSETGNIEASIEMVRLDASMTTGPPWRSGFRVVALGLGLAAAALAVVASRSIRWCWTWTATAST